MEPEVDGVSRAPAGLPPSDVNAQIFAKAEGCRHAASVARSPAVRLGVKEAFRRPPTPTAADLPGSQEALRSIGELVDDLGGRRDLVDAIDGVSSVEDHRLDVSGYPFVRRETGKLG